jgi:hypothetical protein
VPDEEAKTVFVTARFEYSRQIQNAIRKGKNNAQCAKDLDSLSMSGGDPS